MCKKCLSATLVVLLLNLAFYSTAAADTENDVKFAEKVKASVIKLGADENSKIAVKLRDGTELKGYLSDVKDFGFVLKSGETGAAKEIQYSQVKQIKGQSFSNGRNFFVRATIIVGVLLLYGYLFSRSSDY